VFYLNLVDFCPFAYDLHLGQGMDSMAEPLAFLRRYGRTLQLATMEAFLFDHQIRYPVAFLDPSQEVDALGNLVPFAWGPYQDVLQKLFVPVPRMLDVPVEDALVALPPELPFDPLVETRESYDHRQFWRTYHEAVDEHDPETMGEFFHLKGERHAGFDVRLHTYDVDMVDHYLHHCQLLKLFPHAPLQEPIPLAYNAASWARSRMTRTPVGVAKPILDVCLRRRDMPPGGAHDMAQMFLATRDLSPYTYDPGLCLVNHQGLVHFDGVRYDNEQGDFTTWVLHSLVVQQTIYFHLWMDCGHHLLHQIHRFCWDLGRELLHDMDQNRFSTRWTWLQHVHTCGDCERFLGERARRHTIYQRDDARDIMALQLYRNQTYKVFTRLLTNSAARGATDQHSPYAHEFLLLTLPTLTPSRRTEIQLMHDLQWSLDVASFWVEFAGSVGPLVDMLTDTRRTLQLRNYMGSGMSFLAFAPVWKRSMETRPSLTGVERGLRIPFAQVVDNHRYQKYENFLRTRAVDMQARHEHVDPGQSDDTVSRCKRAKLVRM
jgi:hypothetical protein